MGDKYHYDNNCDWFDEERERRDVLAKRTHGACVALIWVSLFWIWGTVGSVDLGKMSITGFLTSTVITLCVILASMWIDSQLYRE